MQKPLFIPRPLVRVNQWTIFSFTVASWLTEQYWLLLIPLIANMLGLFFNFNPIMKAARLLLKKPLNSYIPEDPTQQKFNSCIAIACLLIGYLGFFTGHTVLGYAFTIMVALASFIAILGFCIGCFLFFQLNQFKYKIKKQSV